MSPTSTTRSSRAIDAPAGALRLREALVIALAIVALGGAWIYAAHRERLAAIGEAARQVELPAPPSAPPALPLLAQLEETLRLHPMDLETRYQLAQALIATGDTERAAEHLRLLAILDPAKYGPR